MKFSAAPIQRVPVRYEMTRDRREQFYEPTGCVAAAGSLTGSSSATPTGTSTNTTVTFTQPVVDEFADFENPEFDAAVSKVMDAYDAEYNAKQFASKDKGKGPEHK